MSSDIHALSGAYAVDALDDLERAQFERHLAECETCRAEVRSLREATAMLAQAVRQEPPAGLRDRVLAGIDTVRPLPPVVPAPEQRRRRRLPLLLAAAAVAAVVGIGAVAAWQPWDDDTSQGTPSAAERVRQAPDAETFTQRVDGATVTLVRSAQLNQAVISAEGLPELDESQVYEMWLLHDGLMVPAGIMEGESGELELEGDPATAQGAGITVEPAGGSPEPSSDPVLTFEFEQA
ncbi:anti-sigma factor domain-containing protein [Nocardioides sp. cx-173]|uniref:anti-sigma factor n=1 Tax=Nocardioides sp. cx-173 TaxID=2898796 RepID=UPI001E3A82DB|nr:anti-sigma factor [Nocardioides sp. cx-173]MCD4523882.1 anti-sigma factor [Nocardioides sp. cx-173]UGB41799.1 anti-sigma factor [Nocardioides sp. cx-173]